MAKEKAIHLMDKGHEQQKAEKRAEQFKEKLKEKLEREERAYWRARQERKFGKLSDIN